MIRTIKPEAANIRTNAGKVIAPSPVIVTGDGYNPSVQRLRTNAGKVIATTPSVVTETVYQPTFQAIRKNAGKGISALSIKESLQSRIMLGFSGASTSSDMGLFTGLSSSSSVNNSTFKLGSSSLGVTTSAAFGGGVGGLETRRILQGLKQFSICCWHYHLSFTYGGPWANWDSNGAASGQILLLNESGTTPTAPVAYVAYNGSSLLFISASSGHWQINTWYYSIVEVDLVNLKFRYYSNNSLIGEQSFPSSASINLGNEGFGIGGYNHLNNTITNMNGYIDEFVILTGNTTQAERDWLWNSGNGNSLV